MKNLYIQLPARFISYLHTLESTLMLISSDMFTEITV